jgi:hypothetical protein
MSEKDALRRELLELAGRSERLFPLRLGHALTLEVYPRSVRWLDDEAIVLGVADGEKVLVAISPGLYGRAALDFEGATLDIGDRIRVRRCPMNHHNAEVVRDLFEFTRPVLIGAADSFGFGDRLGLAGPAHIRAVRGSSFRAVLAQQSIRELERTGRTPDEVMDGATWAVLREGYTEGFGSDADHLKTPEHIDRMASAGFTMFTIDPGDHVQNGVDRLSASELNAAAATLPWEVLEDTLANTVARYADRRVLLPGDIDLEPTSEQVLRALVKYGSAIAHCTTMYRHLLSRRPAGAFELEVSVDETDTVTSPFEHLLFAAELGRQGVQWVGLAPRFVGRFEKGVEFRGDLDAFRTLYRQHQAVATANGGYKISIHSGSDKFSVYRVIGRHHAGRVHVKTAGTSYLEALRTAAVRSPQLFRSILDFARSSYENERRTYHVSAALDRVPAAADLGDHELPGLLDQDDARQVLHVTFGRVLTARDDAGEPLFKDRLLASLRANEEIHEGFVESHLRRHVDAFLAGARGDDG